MPIRRFRSNRCTARIYFAVLCKIIDKESEFPWPLPRLMCGRPWQTSRTDGSFTVPLFVHGRSLAGGSGLRFPYRSCGATAPRAPLYPGAGD